jgi:hypothetical protein
MNTLRVSSFSKPEMIETVKLIGYLSDLEAGIKCKVKLSL